MADELTQCEKIRRLPTPSEWMDKFGIWFVPEPNTGCWLWNRGSHRGHRYGITSIGSAKKYAHRVAYEVLRGPIPAGLDIDHLCRNRICVNPDHLEPVTRQVNVLRGERGQRTHCPQGHEYTPENTLISKARHRRCRECHRQREHQRHEARRGR